MYKFTVLLIVLACFIMAEAQLTFTSSWGTGKRSGVAGTISCRNEETLASIYRLIQNEAEKLLLCHKP